MSKFKVGDDVEVISVDHFSSIERELFNLKVGDNGKIIGFHKRYGVFAIVENQKFKNSRAGGGKLYIPKSHLIKIGESQMQYEESNRYKLREAVKKTGHAATHLSLAADQNQYYFGSEMKESRFNSRGDLNETQFNKLLTNLAFAECELNGVPAKVVDKKPLENDIDYSKIYAPIDLEPKEIYEQEIVSKLIYSQNRKRIKKSKTEVSRKVVWFVIFLIVVLFIYAVTGVVKHIFF